MNIRRKLSLIVIISILVTAIPASLLVAHFTQQSILKQEVESLTAITATQFAPISQRFNSALPKLSNMARLIQEELSKPVTPDEIDEFHQTMFLNEDGVWRNRRGQFNGLIESGVFLPHSDSLTDLQKIQNLRIKRVMDFYGAASTELHENIWYLSLYRSEVIFDKSIPDFAFDQQTDNDYTQTPWVTLTSPELNPDKKLTFTPPLFDPVPKVWMVSAVYPLYFEGEWIGSLGEDMQLTNVFATLLEKVQLYPDTQHFLVDQQGNYILAGQWQAQLEDSADGRIDLSMHNDLVSLFDKKSEFQSTSAKLLSDNISIDGKKHIALGLLIEPVDWYYVRLIPVNNLIQPAKHMLFALVVFIFVVSMLCGGLINSAVNRNVIDRLSKLSNFIRRYESGDTLNASKELTGTDEIALAAREFDVMAERIDRYVEEANQAKEDLHQSKQRWKFALEGAGDGVWDWNIETGVIVYSAQWKAMLGFSVDELEANYETFFSLVHPDDQERVQQAVVDYLENVSAGYAVEFRMRCKNGSWKWVLSRGMVTQRDDELNPLRMIGTHTDISYLKRVQEEQETNSQHLRDLMLNSPIAVRISSPEGDVVRFANLSYDELINKKELSSIGVNPENFYADHADYEQILKEVHSGQKVTNRLVHLSIPGQGYKWALATYSLITYEGELALIGWFYDVSERLKAEEAIRLHASVFDNAWEGIVISDAQNRIIAINRAFTEITGYSIGELKGQNPKILSSGRQDELFYQKMWEQLKADGHWRGEVWNRKKGGELYAEILTISSVKDTNGKITHYVGIFADITEMKNTERLLENMAHYDALTSLPNRALLSDRLEQALSRAERSNSVLAVCFMDLDGFKPVNDTYGHDIGDELLVEIANRLEFNIRSGDTVARMGGDEFVILITHADDVKDLDPILSRLISAVSQPVKIKSHEVVVSASIGVAIYPADDVDADTLLRHADLAMYEAKQAGRNGYHIFDATLDREMHEHHVKVERISLGLVQNEFRLYYQPKVNLRTGDVMGMEALIRWQHPDEGLLGPFEFLPYIEGTELIVELGDWVIMNALAQVQLWQDAGAPLQVSVNVAARQIQEPSFIDKLDQALAYYPDVPSNLLELEILETSALETYQTAQVVKDTAKRLGVQFALDDFGTGYSSLSYLKQLSAKTLKIDQSFIRDMLEDREDQAIVEAVIELAKVFNRDVVAEGVETPAHILQLMEMGCDIAQGYGIARPMPAEEVLDWVIHYQQQNQNTVS